MRGQEVSKRRPVGRASSVVALAAAVLLLAAPAGAVFTGSWQGGPDAPIAPADGGKGQLDVLEPASPTAAAVSHTGTSGPAERVVKEWVATDGGKGGGPKSSKGK